jgi:hypothetical protein
MIRTAIVMGVLFSCATAFADDAKAEKKPTEKKPAEPAAPPAMPTPDAALDAWKPMVKAWSCSGTNGAGDKTTAKMTYKAELGGFWFSGDFKPAKTKGPAFEGMVMFGQDPVKKDWVMEGWDNFGGALHLRSKDGLAWTGTSVDEGKETPASFNFGYDAKTKHHTFNATIGGKKVADYDCK